MQRSEASFLRPDAPRVGAVLLYHAPPRPTPTRTPVELPTGGPRDDVPHYRFAVGAPSRHHRAVRTERDDVHVALMVLAASELEQVSSVQRAVCLCVGECVCVCAQRRL